MDSGKSHAWLCKETRIFLRTKSVKTINDVVTFLARFFYHVICKISGFLTASQSYFEIILINAFQAGDTASGTRRALGACQLPAPPTGSLQAPAPHSRGGLPAAVPP